MQEVEGESRERHTVRDCASQDLRGRRAERKRGQGLVGGERGRARQQEEEARYQPAQCCEPALDDRNRERSRQIAAAAWEGAAGTLAASCPYREVPVR